MFNTILLLLYLCVVAGLSLFMLRLGKEAACMWLVMLGLSMNLFVIKQISLFSLHVTASEALVVGYLLTLNLIQEFYGAASAQRAVRTNFFILLAFVLLSRLHLLYQGEPNHDIFTPLPRLFLASLASFFVVQFFDLALFARLRRALAGRYLVLRTMLCLLASQTIDTFLFTFLGLWGLVDHPFHVIAFSLLVKSAIILLQAPFAALARRVVDV